MALPPTSEAAIRSAMEALEAFLVNNLDLDKLEALASRFNVFEAMGVVRHELRHSDFLAFLLDPRQTHGLGSLFTKRLLQRALQGGRAPVSLAPIHIDLMDLDGLAVRREWRGIDIFLADETNRLAVIIENKIDATEHSNQLQRYWDVVAADHAGWHVIGLYVTPDGDPPSHEGYAPIGYGVVAELVDEIADRRAPIMQPDVRVLVTHYAQMLRRHIVAESEIALLCRQIYQKHRLALDLIFEHRPDRLSRVRDILEGLVLKSDGLRLEPGGGKTYVRFLPLEWDVPLLAQGTGWTSSKSMLLFEFHSTVDRIVLRLYVGPGPEGLRQALLDLALAHGLPFKPSSKSLKAKWNSLYQRQVWSATSSPDNADEDLDERIQKAWDAITEQDLPTLTSVVVAWLGDLGQPT